MTSGLLDVEPPQAAWFDETLQAWRLSLHTDVTDALHHPNLSAGQSGTAWHRGYREEAAASFAGSRLNEWKPVIERTARSFVPDGNSFDGRKDFAEPFSQAVATLVTGESRAESFADACAIFASASNPFDLELRRCSDAATQRLAERMSVIEIQAFVALSKSLPAFINNCLYVRASEISNEISTSTIEELLRFAGPAKAQIRSASGSLIIGDASVAKGDSVLLMLASANRDPNAFSNPHRFDEKRSPNPHLAFGAGPHSCLGSALVRVASLAALTAFFNHFPSIQVESATRGDGLALRAIEARYSSPSKPPHPDQH